MKWCDDCGQKLRLVEGYVKRKQIRKTGAMLRLSLWTCQSLAAIQHREWKQSPIVTPVIQVDCKDCGVTIELEGSHNKNSLSLWRQVAHLVSYSIPSRRKDTKDWRNKWELIVGQHAYLVNAVQICQKIGRTQYTQCQILIRRNPADGRQ
jgi:hypothetical protein